MRRAYTELCPRGKGGEGGSGFAESGAVGRRGAPHRREFPTFPLRLPTWLRLPPRCRQAVRHRRSAKVRRILQLKPTVKVRPTFRRSQTLKISRTVGIHTAHNRGHSAVSVSSSSVPYLSACLRRTGRTPVFRRRGAEKLAAGESEPGMLPMPTLGAGTACCRARAAVLSSADCGNS